MSDHPNLFDRVKAAEDALLADGWGKTLHDGYQKALHDHYAEIRPNDFGSWEVFIQKTLRGAILADRRCCDLPNAAAWAESTAKRMEGAV